MNLIEKIKKSNSSNILNKADEATKKELIQLTNFLPNGTKIPIRYYYVKNDINAPIVCKGCSKHPKFISSISGFSNFCSRNCKKKYTAINNAKKLLKSSELKLKSEPDKWIKCELCKSAVKLIKNHLLYSHKDISFREYVKRFPNAKTVADSTSLILSENSSGDKNVFHTKNSTKLERKQRSIFSIESWKLKYPNKSKEELCKIRNLVLKKKLKNRLTECNIEYWIKKGYTKEEAKKKLSERQKTFSLKKCIQKYGKEGGTKRFNVRQKKWIESLNKNFEIEGDGRSPSSKFANYYIEKICEQLSIKIPIKEKWMCSGNGELRCSYDFVYKNKIIEFNGDYWHMNPALFKANEINKTSKLSAEEMWNKDKRKIQLAESYGYNVLVIWESDHNKDPEKVFNRCLKFLNG